MEEVKDQYLLLNIAIEPGIDPSFTEDTLEIDYVRIYQAANMGILEMEQVQELKLYPNPVNDQLQLEVPKEVSKVNSIVVYSLDGVKVMERQKISITQGTLELSGLAGLPNGNYQLRLITDTGDYSYRFLKS